MCTDQQRMYALFEAISEQPQSQTLLDGHRFSARGGSGRGGLLALVYGCKTPPTSVPQHAPVARRACKPCSLTDSLGPPKWMRLAQPQREVAEPVPGHVQGLEASGPLGSSRVPLPPGPHPRLKPRKHRRESHQGHTQHDPGHKNREGNRPDPGWNPRRSLRIQV